MTIIEAICRSLDELNTPSTYEEIYNHIVNNGYYHFGAKSPVSVVRVQLRLHTDNVAINSGKRKTKYFHSEEGKGVNEKFTLLDIPIKIKVNSNNEKLENNYVVKSSVVKDHKLYDSIFSWYNKQDFSIHKITLLECFWMLLGCFMPILVDSFLRMLLLSIPITDAIYQNLKSGEVFLLTSALIMPFCFVLISYINSDDENKKINKLPYFGGVLLATLISLISGIFTFVYFRIGQLVREKAESDAIKAMFSFEFGNWAIIIFILSFIVWYYSSYMNHRSTDNYKKIRKKQINQLGKEYNPQDKGQVA